MARPASAGRATAPHCARGHRDRQRGRTCRRCRLRHACARLPL